MITKLFYTIHRILGTLLSILFFMWFVSGIVMIYHYFPQANAKEKMEKLEPLPVSLPAVEEILTRIPDSCLVEGISVSKYLGQTTFKVDTDKGAFMLPADSAGQLPEINWNYITQVAHLWCDAPIVKVDSLYHLEQWIPFNSLKKHFPIYKFHFSDDAETELYISSHTGEVLQQTNGSERFWSWIGAIPHWVYFTQLRQNADLWMKSVIWLSAIGCLMTIAGLYVGIHAYCASRKRSKKLHSPYKKRWYYWHHVTGVVFGLFVLTWVFSGMMSLADVPEWIGKTEQTYPVRKVMNENIPPLSDYPLDYRKVIADYKGKVTSLEWGHFHSVPLYHLYLGSKKVTVDASSTSVKPLNLTETQVTEAVKAIHGEDICMQVGLLTEYDNYYTARSGHLALPVWKVAVNNVDKTCYYINPSNGSYRDYNTHKRWGFWMYSGMHSLRFKFLIEHPMLWTIVIWTLLLGGATVSLTGIVLGMRYLKRLCRRKKTTVHRLD